MKVLDELSSREETTKVQVLRRTVALLNCDATERDADSQIAVLSGPGRKILKEVVTTKPHQPKSVRLLP